jgi:hypothetical protein
MIGGIKHNREMYSIVAKSFSCTTENITAVIKAKINRTLSRFVRSFGVVLF